MTTSWGDLWRTAFRKYVTADNPESGANEPDKDEIFNAISATEATVTEIAASQTAGMIRFETWAQLAAVPGTANGQGGAVTYNDLGSHTDPVVGGSVANAGQYRWNVSPAGWKRIDNLPQMFDTDLQAIANLTPANDDVIQRKAGAWTNRTIVQFKADLGLDALTQDETEDAQRNVFYTQRNVALNERPRAAVIVHLGQSNNVPRGTATLTGITSSEAFMPVGGNAISKFDFFITNDQHVAHYADLASVVTHAEGTDADGTTPVEGVGGALITTFLGGMFPRVYQCSAAIGSRDLVTLGQAGPRTNLYAVLNRLCDHARAAGYRPVVMYTAVNGEAAIAAGLSEDTYYANGIIYYQMAQLAAAQAMERPDYVVPILFEHPVFMQFGNVARGIQNAIRRLSLDLEGGLNLGGLYPYETNSDRTHNTMLGFVQRGEAAGARLRRYFETVEQDRPLHIIDARRNGTTVVARMSHPCMRDTAYTYGTNLNTTKALGGFEYDDNGTEIQITALTVAGLQATLTLASTPTGGVGNERLRLAAQLTAAALVAGPSNRAGSQIRKTGTGWQSLYDPTFTHFEWAIPQMITVRISAS